MENEVEIGKDGTVKVEIDSSVAKELFGILTINMRLSLKLLTFHVEQLPVKELLLPLENPSRLQYG
jgi:hypothetical protein